MSMKKIRRNVLLLMISSLFILSFFVTPEQIKAVYADDVQEIYTNVTILEKS